MSVSQKDIIIYGSSTMPDSDSTTNIGGPVKKSIKMCWEPISATDNLNARSSSHADLSSIKVTVYGRNSAGELKNETITLDGCTAVASTLTYNRILKASVTGAPDGDLSLYRSTIEHWGKVAGGAGADYLTFGSTGSAVDDTYQFHVLIVGSPAGTKAYHIREIVDYTGSSKKADVRDWTGTDPDTTYRYWVHEGVVFDKSPNQILQCRRPFYNVAADPVGGSELNYYEKVFVFNENTSNALTNATLAEVAEGASAKIEFALDTGLGGRKTNGANNRTVAPTFEVGSFNSTAKDFSNSKNFSTNTAQGVWLHLTLSAGDAASNSYYKLRVSGQSV